MDFEKFRNGLWGQEDKSVDKGLALKSYETYGYKKMKS